jgi:hypothetical protein
MIIQHNSIEADWDNEEVLNNAETLILGSFNPFNPSGGNPNFYYGRKTNYLWKIIGEVLHNDSNYYFDNIKRKYDVMIEKKFCFLDIINSIEVANIEEDDNLLNSFIKEKIFTNFSDSVLFTKKTSYLQKSIFIKRVYNFKVQNLLDKRKINKIIHTLGNNTIKINFDTKWKENNLGENGFQGYINSLVNFDINFIPISYSPSQLVVNREGTGYQNNLRNWLIENLTLL